MNNPTLEVIRNRTSLRVFSEQEITKEEEDTIIESAMLAPTAGNQMLYSMIVVRDEERKRALAYSCDDQMFIGKAPLVIVFVADQHRWFEYFQQNDVKEFCLEHGRSFLAPQESDLLLAIEDAMVAAQNSVIAAESLGIGSCYIGDIIEEAEFIRELLHLPQYTMPIGLVVYGHYPKNHKKVFRKRFDRKYIVFEDVYKQLSTQDYKDMFKERETIYRPENTFGAENFAQQFYARKTGADFSKEMARSVRVWLKQWDGRML